jgi:hypothetical protein
MREAESWSLEAVGRFAEASEGMRFESENLHIGMVGGVFCRSNGSRTPRHGCKGPDAAPHREEARSSRTIFPADFVLHSQHHTMLTRPGESGIDAFAILGLGSQWHRGFAARASRLQWEPSRIRGSRVCVRYVVGSGATCQRKTSGEVIAQLTIVEIRNRNRQRRR